MGNAHLKPSFFIIGERKCGTSSLYRYLCAHPQVLPCRVKEPQFFSRPFVYRLFNFNKYLALFPPEKGKDPVELEWITLNEDGSYSSRIVKYQRDNSRREITGEASANTMAGVPPSRLHGYFPGALIIVLLRDPVQRAYSHYRMLERFASEGRRLPFRITNFHDDTIAEINNIRKGKNSYFVAPGMYSVTLASWMDQFGEGQMQVIFTKDLDNLPGLKRVLTEIASKLQIEAFDFDAMPLKKYNESGKSEIPASTAEILRNFYLPYNQQLRRLLNRDLPWN